MSPIYFREAIGLLTNPDFLYAVLIGILAIIGVVRNKIIRNVAGVFGLLCVIRVGLRYFDFASFGAAIAAAFQAAFLAVGAAFRTVFQWVGAVAGKAAQLEMADTIPVLKGVGLLALAVAAAAGLFCMVCMSGGFAIELAQTLAARRPGHALAGALVHFLSSLCDSIRATLSFMSLKDSCEIKEPPPMDLNDLL